VSISFPVYSDNQITDLANSYGILKSESERLWAFWLGLPVPPRQWKLKAPGSDDPMRNSVDYKEL
jgi:hypothetical protein